MSNNLHLRGTQELKLCETVKAVDASLANQHLRK